MNNRGSVLVFCAVPLTIYIILFFIGLSRILRVGVSSSMQGILTNETRCLRCETVTARDETFLDLSVDIEQNSSITSCLKNFSSTETLNAEDKFFCDKCCRCLSSPLSLLF